MIRGMDDLSVFVRGYTKDSLSRIRYAGILDPQNPETAECWKLPRERRDDFLENDDPNSSFRSAVRAYLFRPQPNTSSTGSEASDELIHDLLSLTGNSQSDTDAMETRNSPRKPCGAISLRRSFTPTAFLWEWRQGFRLKWRFTGEQDCPENRPFPIC